MLNQNVYADGYIINYSSEGNIVSVFEKDVDITACAESVNVELCNLRTIKYKKRTINRKTISIIELTFYSKKTGSNLFEIFQEELTSKDRERLKLFLKKGSTYLTTFRYCGSGGIPSIEGIKLQNR
jgi:hypothetical protein